LTVANDQGAKGLPLNQFTNKGAVWEQHVSNSPKGVVWFAANQFERLMGQTVEMPLLQSGSWH
tara:strand:- start:88 stop:276 length:189 start_codon:yes stop_codon:yes gene_type:complete